MMREITSISSITRLIGAGVLVEAGSVAHENAEFVGRYSFGVSGSLTRSSRMRTGYRSP